MADFVAEFFGRGVPSLLEGAPTSFTGEFFTNGGSASTTRYAQRVFSSGLGVWCYYIASAVNPTPLSADTTPNWTGAITAFEVLAILR